MKKSNVKLNIAVFICIAYLMCCAYGVYFSCNNVLNTTNETTSQTAKSSQSANESVPQEAQVEEEIFVFEDDELIITTSGDDESNYLTLDVPLAIENKTSKTLQCYVDNITIEGYNVGGYFDNSADLTANSKTITNLSLYKDDINNVYNAIGGADFLRVSVTLQMYDASQIRFYNKTFELELYSI